MNLDFLATDADTRESKPFRGIFIRAPIVETLLPQLPGEQVEEAHRSDTVIAPSRTADGLENESNVPVSIMAKLPGRSQNFVQEVELLGLEDEVGDVVAVRQRNVFGTSFHPELTDDARIHIWWLNQVKAAVLNSRAF